MHAVALDGKDGKGKKEAPVLCHVCGLVLMFCVIFWIVLLSFVILSSPMSLFVFLNCSIILVFLKSVFQNFFAKSSVLLCLI